MEKVIKLTLIFFLHSCFNNENVELKGYDKFVTVQISHDQNIDIKSINQKTRKQNKRGYNPIYINKLLRVNNITIDTIPDGLILDYKEKLINDELIIGLLKIEMTKDKEFGINFRGDPIANIIFIKKKTSDTFLYKTILSSVYEDDVIFKYRINPDIETLEYYSSPVGYTQLYLFKINNNTIFRSDIIKEGELVDTSSLDFTTNQFKVKSVDSKKVIRTLEEIGKW